MLEQVLEVLVLDLQPDAVPESRVELEHGDLQEPAEIEVPLVEDCEVFGEPGASRALALVEGVDRLRERQPDVEESFRVELAADAADEAH